MAYKHCDNGGVLPFILISATATSTTPPPQPPPPLTQECHSSSADEACESICWGCGLRLILPSNAPLFKCGWCGAITKSNSSSREHKNMRRRHLRDQCSVTVLFFFMIFVICGGVWAVFPVVFSVSYLCGIFHCIITFMLSLATVSMFVLASFCDAGTPPPTVWGSYPLVRKDDLQDYTFCQFCSKPKSPRTHHCSSCGKCVLDMDHHCPFIGNCVGAANHRYFASFLIVAISSVTYAAIMSAYASLHIFPTLNDQTIQKVHSVGKKITLMGILKELFISLVTSALLFSPRGLVLAYLFIASISVGISLTVLLCQQLHFIYEGRTYLTSLSSRVEAEKDCRNLYRFFGCPYFGIQYLRNCCSSSKIHRK